MSRTTRPIDALSPAERRALLSQLLSQRPAEVRRAPASFAQQRLWILEELNPGSAAYTVPVAMRLTDATAAVAERALAELAVRHEALRTTFSSTDGELVEVIAPRREIPVERIDLRHMDTRACQQELQRLHAEESRRVFDLRRGPLVRARLVTLAERDHVLLLTLHHIVCDAWSMNVLFHEIGVLCRAFTRGEPSPLSPLPIRYGDFAAWQRSALSGPTYERHVAYWRAQLAGAPTLLDLPADRPPTSNPAPPAGNVPFTVPSETYARIEALARSEGATVFMALVAAFSLLLQRYTHQRDILVGTPIANRGRSELEGLVGFFTNTLVLRLRLPGGASLRDLVRHARAVTLEAYAHQDLPFEKLVEELRPDRDLTRNPLFQVMFAVQNQHRAGASEHGGTGLLATGSAKFALTMTLVADAEQLGGTLEYNAEMFDRATAERLVRHYLALLAAGVEAPDRVAAGLPLLTTGELAAQAQGRTGAQRLWEASQPHLTLHQLIECQARRTPDAVAVEAAEGRLTYAELDARATRLACRLRAADVDPDSAVAVCVRRSTELMVALLGVLKAGAVFVPVDLHFGAERVAYMLGDSGASVILVQPDSEAELPTHAAVVISLGPDALERDDTATDGETDALSDADNGPASGPLPTVDPEQLAYIIYTSGSTGRPKGVMVSHAAIHNHTLWMLEQWPLTADDAVLHKTPTSFDASIWELFVPLAAGARLIMVPPGAHQDSREIVRYMRDRGATVAQFVPSLLQAVVEEPEFRDCGRLRLLFCGGEPLPTVLARRAAAASQATVVNLYGPTEATIDATAWTYDPADAGAVVPIGRPIANVGAYVLDDELEEVPVGAIGELYLSGAGLARGYLANPRATAERFLPDRYAATPGARMYATGDLVRRRGDDVLEFVGRADHQVKVRGHRIELGEIDSLLIGHPRVREAVTVLRTDDGARHRLVAYVAPSDGGADEETLALLREHLRAHLPDWMVPAQLVILPRLPTTPNGKIDRRALPSPPEPAPQEARAPRDEVERAIADAWTEVLHVEVGGVNDDFFRLGGHSLAAMRVASRLRDALQVDLQLRALFEHTTLGELAEHARSLRAGSVQVHGAEDTRPTPGQRRVWLAEQIEPGGPAQHVVARVNVSPASDPAALQQALDDLARRHPVLRSVCVLRDGEPSVLTGGGARTALGVIDLQSYVPSRRAAAVERLCEAETSRPFAMATGPLLRATLIRTGEPDDALLLVAHALVADRCSLSLVAARLCGNEDMPETDEASADWLTTLASWRRAVVDDPVTTEAWRERLAAARAASSTPLPSDRPPPKVRGHRAHTGRFALDEEGSAALVAAVRAAGGDLGDAVLALTAALLHHWTGASDVLLLVRDDGRTDRGTARLIGPLVGRVPVHLTIDAGASGSSLLRQAAAARRNALAPGVARAELHVEAATAGLGSPLALPRVMVDLTAPPDAWEPLDVLVDADLCVRLLERSEGVECLVACAADVFDASRGADVAAALAAIAEALARESHMALHTLLHGALHALHALPRPDGPLPSHVPSPPWNTGPTAEPATPMERRVESICRAQRGRAAGVESAGTVCEAPVPGDDAEAALRLSTALHDTLGVTLPVRCVLEADSVATLARDVLEAALAREDPSAVTAYLEKIALLSESAAEEQLRKIESGGRP